MTPAGAWRRRAAIALALAAVTGAGAVAAQPLAERLAAVKGATCSFEVQATGDWRDGEPRVDTRAATLTVAFTAIDSESGTAQAVGAYGISDIIVRVANGYLHLVQSFRDGPLYVTTLLPRELDGGRLLAVHTRHEYTLVSLPGFTSRPEQYYGSCEVER